MGMDFGLLGPLLVGRDGGTVPIPAGHQRTLLAALLFSRGQVVSAEHLIEMFWAVPPASARASLHNYVKRLRQALGDAGHSRILTQSGGYAIRVDAAELDVSRFEALLESARAGMRASAWDRAAAEARASLSLWRGEPLADVECEILTQRETPRLAELRLQALEIRLEAELRLGGQADVIPELAQLARAHPFREQVHAQLMQALYLCGRQAEALAAYAEARRALVEELGTEPGPRLRELHQQILSAEPILARPAPEPSPRDGAAPAAPRTVPAAVSHFTGRDGELAALSSYLEQAGGQAGTAVPLAVISGTAGVGKTALAVHWAHRVAGRFPGGQLYVNLHGYDADQPTPPDAALASFLRALGVPGREIPVDADERAARFRSLLAGRRILVLLDNARSADQVRPLLPATAGCAAVVTSRDSMAGLVARDGAWRLDLDLLRLADAAALLAALVGERAVADQAATRTLAVLCARLPLALRVAAERALTHPGQPVASLVAELTDEQRLDLLNAGGDLRTAVRAVFSWSYQSLDPAAARGFRLIALHPGPDVEVFAAAALTGVDLDQVRPVLTQLARAYLIQPSGPDRYGLHDLLRVYARELAATHDAEPARRAALTRLLDHYLHSSVTAANVLYPADHHRRPEAPRLVSPAPPLATPAQAQAWLDSERASLVTAVSYAAARGWPGHATRLQLALFRYLDTGGHLAEAVTVHDGAVRAAQQTGDLAAEAEALLSLGTVDLRQGRYQVAAERLERSLDLFLAGGDPSGQARVLHNLGVLGLHTGRYTEAAGYFQQAAELNGAVGDRYGEARALGNLGVIAMQQGRYQQAGDYHHRVLGMFQEMGDRSGEAHAWIMLGNLDRREERFESAAGHLRQALAMFRAAGDRSGEAYTLTDLGDVELKRGLPGQAIDRHRQSLVLFRQTGNPAGQAKALNGLGEALLAAGRATQARDRLTDALSVAHRIDDPYEEARAHHSLGDVSHVLGDPGQADRHWNQALTGYRQLDAPEAEQVRARLLTRP